MLEEREAALAALVTGVVVGFGVLTLAIVTLEVVRYIRWKRRGGHANSAPDPEAKAVCRERQVWTKSEVWTCSSSGESETVALKAVSRAPTEDKSSNTHEK